MTQEEIKNLVGEDLVALENEVQKLRTQMADLDSQRVTISNRIQNVIGAIAYIKGKLPEEAPIIEDTTEDTAEEESKDTTEENSEA